MTNSYVTSDLVAPRAQVFFELNNTILREAASDYQGMFKNGTYETGDTVNVRLDNQFIVQRGDTVTDTDIVEAKEPLTIEELYSVNIKLKPTDRQREIGDFTQHITEPATRNLISKINKDVFARATDELYLTVGDPSALITSYGASDEANILMQEMGVPASATWMQILNPKNAGALRQSTQIANNYNQTVTKDVLATSSLGHLGAFDMFIEQGVDKHTTFSGAIGTPIVNGAVASGNSIVASGFTGSQTAILKKGDVVQFTGAYHVDPVLRESTGRLFTGVVLADADSTAGGAVTFTISPTIISAATNPRQNISNEIPNGATITVIGQTQVNYANNIAYRPGGLIFINPALTPFKGSSDSTISTSKGGISLRATFYDDPQNNAERLRLDAQVAYKWMPRWAVKLVSSI